MLTTRSVVTTTTIQPQMTPQYYAAAPPAPRVSATPPAPQLNHSLGSSPSFTNNKITKFEIAFATDGQKGAMPGIFFTGERLSGHICLQTRQPLKALNKNKTLTEISQGAHSWPISVDLPTNLLPSLECEGNFVKYSCKATIVRHLDKNSIEIERPFDVYQDNTNVYSDIAEQQYPVDCDLVTGSVAVSYQINKTGFFIGEVPTVVGDILNNSSSPAQVRVGLDVVRTIDVRGEVNLGVTKVGMTAQRIIEGNGQWSTQITVPAKSSLPFSLELDLGFIPPTTSCLEVDITHKLRFKVLREKSFSITKSKPKIREHEIKICRPDAGSEIKKNSSRVSLGKGMTKRRAPPPKPTDEIIGVQASGQKDGYPVPAPRRPRFSLQDQQCEDQPPPYSEY